MKQIGVGILGFGTVGAGVAGGLLNHREVMARRLGVDIVLRKVADLDITTDRGVAVPADVLTTDAESVVADPSVDIVVESAARPSRRSSSSPRWPRRSAW